MRWLLAFAIFLTTSPVAAQPVVTSLAPEAVSVSIYRDPDRGSGGEIALDSLNGFALITETRTVDLPAGDAMLRFEGVAEGMVAVSAIVTGLPGGVVQKNRDAALLSPASLLDGTLGNRVHIRRTSRATGVVSQEDAVIRTGPDGAVILQTAAGFEALRCTGVPESLIYDGVPKGLSAKPTLSVTTRSPAAQRVTLTLTYLATGFDWAANYVAQVQDDGKTLDLFAWLTIANSNGESFADAQLFALAGTLNVESDYEELAGAPPQPTLYLRCFPTGSGRNGRPPPPLMMARGGAARGYAEDEMSIVVTAQRLAAPMESASPVSVVAVQEELGDLKLYRVPIPVTVAANAQKQVALLVKDAVPFERIYRFREAPDGEVQTVPSQIILRMQNKEVAKLGVPLPSGQVAVFETVGGQRLLAGEGDARDHAVGEIVNLAIGESSQVRVTIENFVSPKNSNDDYRAVVTNANPYPVKFELGFTYYDEDDLDKRLRNLPRKDGLPTWIVTVPANSSRSFGYRVPRD